MADFKPTIKKHAINERKLQLHTTNASNKPATLKFNIHKNYPRIDVYTNDDNDPKAKEPIRAALDQPSFYMFLEMLAAANAAKEPVEYAMENKNFTFFGGKKSEKPEVVSKLLVGKDDKGVVYISVTGRSRPKIRFPMIPSRWNYLVDSSTGNIIEESKASYLTTKAWISMLTQLVGNYLVTNFEEEVQKEQNNSGGENRWKEQSKQNTSASSSFDDGELPF